MVIVSATIVQTLPTDQVGGLVLGRVSGPARPARPGDAVNTASTMSTATLQLWGSHFLFFIVKSEVDEVGFLWNCCRSYPHIILLMAE